LGRKLVEGVRVADLIPYIDWSPLFWTWELKGVYPAILKHPKYGEQARNLYDEAEVLLRRIAAEDLFKPKAVFGIWPARSIGDDVEINLGGSEGTARFHFLRQQKRKPEGESHYALSDFVAPSDSGRRDFMGAFAVTMGDGVERLAKEFEAAGDDFGAIMAKALGDRLAEAFTEKLHQDVRRLWGYGRDEKFSHEELIGEKYRGIRPAPGYPACPDHTEKRIIWEILAVERAIGLKLTESCAMSPASSISGFYFAHPKAKYFMVGQVRADQVADYAARKGISVAEAEKWLAPNLGW